MDEVKTTLPFLPSETQRRTTPWVSTQRQEDIDLVVLADELDRDLPDRAGLAHAGIVPEHVEIPGLRLGDVIGVGQIETLDPEVLPGPAPWPPRAAA